MTRNYRTRYDYNRDTNWATMNEEASMTQQSDANDTDLNVIMDKYQQTGLVPNRTDYATAQYGDFSGITDYREALETIRKADEAFLDVPAQIREKFKNDPTAFFDYATNPDNIAELRKMGLAKPEEPTETPTTTTATTPTPPTPPTPTTTST